jgi:hypothetical protein
MGSAGNPGQVFSFWAAGSGLSGFPEQREVLFACLSALYQSMGGHHGEFRDQRRCECGGAVWEWWGSLTMVVALKNTHTNHKCWCSTLIPVTWQVDVLGSIVRPAWAPQCDTVLKHMISHQCPCYVIPITKDFINPSLHLILGISRSMQWSIKSTLCVHRITGNHK